MPDDPIWGEWARCPVEGCNGDARYSAPGRGHEDWCVYPRGDNEGPRSSVNAKTSIKMVGEALAYAECAFLNFYPDTGQRAMYAKIIADLLEDVKRQRPTGPDGKHGDRHTDTCGCRVEVCGSCSGVGHFPDDIEGEEGACMTCNGRGYFTNG